MSSPKIFFKVKSENCPKIYNGLNLNIYRQGKNNPVYNNWFEDVIMHFDRFHQNWKVVKPNNCDRKSWNRIQEWAVSTVEDLDKEYKNFLEEKALELSWNITNLKVEGIHHKYWQNFEKEKVSKNKQEKMEMVSEKEKEEPNMNLIPDANEMVKLEILKDEENSSSEKKHIRIDFEQLNRTKALKLTYQRISIEASSKTILSPPIWEQKTPKYKDWSDMTDEAIKAGEYIDPGSFYKIFEMVIKCFKINEPSDYLKIIEQRSFSINLNMALEEFRLNYGKPKPRELNDDGGIKI